MQTNRHIPATLITPVTIVLLFVAMLLPSVTVWGQQSIHLVYEDVSRPIDDLPVDFAIGYKRDGSNNWRPNSIIPLAAGNMIVPVNSPSDAYLLIRIRNNNDQFKRLSVSFKLADANGEVPGEENNYNTNASGEKNKWIEIPLRSDGSNELTVRIDGIPDEKALVVNREKSKTVFNFTVHALENRNDKAIVNRQSLLEKAALHQEFSVMLSPKYEDFEGILSIGHYLEYMEQQIISFHDGWRTKMAVANKNLDDVLKYFEIFGSSNLEDYKLLATYRPEAVSTIETYEKSLWDNRPKDDTQVLAYLENLLRNIPRYRQVGYTPKITAETIQGELEQAVGRLLRSVGQNNFCTKIWRPIKATDYYKARKNDPKFSAAINQCDNPCTKILSDAEGAKNNIDQLKRYLENCKSRDCRGDCEGEITDLIAKAQCREDYASARSIKDAPTRRVKLEYVLAGCPFYESAIKKELAEIAPPQLKEVIKPEWVTDTLENHYLFRYEVVKGMDIQIVRINDRTDPENMQETITYEWTEPNKRIDFRVFTYERDFTIYYKSRSGEEDSILLSSKIFTATMEDLENQQLSVTLQNGRPDYYARFNNVNDHFSLFLPLNTEANSTETLDLSDLATFFPGEFEVNVIDQMGNIGSEENQTVALEQKAVTTMGSNAAPPLYLLIPIVILIAFLTYRNLGGARL